MDWIKNAVSSMEDDINNAMSPGAKKAMQDTQQRAPVEEEASTKGIRDPPTRTISRSSSGSKSVSTPKSASEPGLEKGWEALLGSPADSKSNQASGVPKSDGQQLEITKLKKFSMKLKRENTDLASKLKTLEAQVKDSQSKQPSEEKEKAKEKDSSDMVLKLKKLCTKYKKESTDASETVKTMQKEFTLKQKAFDNTITALKLELDEKSAETADALQQRLVSDERVTVLEANLKESEDKAAAAAAAAALSTINDAANMPTTSESDVQANTERIAKLEEELKTAGEQMKDLESQLTDSNTQVEQLKLCASVAVAAATSDTVASSTHEQATTNTESGGSEADADKVDNTAHADEMEKLMQEIANLKQELTTVTTANDDVDALKQELARMKLQIEPKASTDSDPLASETTQANNNTSDVTDINDNNDSKDNTDSKDANNNNNNNNNNEELEKLKQELVVVNEQIAEMKAEKEETETRASTHVEALTTQITELTQKIQAAELIQEESRSSYDEERSAMLAAIQESQQRSTALLDELTNRKKEVAQLQNTADTTVEKHRELVEVLRSQVREASSRTEGLEERLKSVSNASDKGTSESQAQIATLASECSTLRSRVKQLEVSKAKLDTQLSQEREAHTATKDALENATAGASQSSMLDLEIADYKRTVQSLNSRIKDIDEQLQRQRAVSTEKDTQLTAIKTRLAKEEEINKQEDQSRLKLKTLLLKATKDAKERKTRMSALENSERAVRGQLESKTQEVENLKIELTQLNVSLNTIEAEQHELDTTKDVEIHRLKFELETAKRDLKKSQATFGEAQKELQNYKARAHTLLKQKKDETQPSADALATLSTDLQTANESLKQVTSELEESRQMYKDLEADYDELTSSSDASEDTIKKLKDQLEARGREYQLARNALEQEHMEALKQLRMEHSITLKGQKERYNHQLAEIEKARETLSEELQLSRGQLANQLSDGGNDDTASPTSTSTTTTTTAHNNNSNSNSNNNYNNSKSSAGLTQSNLRALGQRNSSGGRLSPRSSTGVSESAASKVVDLATLLVSQVDAGFGDTNGNASASEIEMAKNQIVHLSTLLSESEGMCERLAQQSAVLKKEIRRQEKNNSRDEGTNLEYLKNVIFKFITAQEEREHLIPALGMLLHFTKDEISEATKGFQRNQAAMNAKLEADKASSETFFFPRW